MLNGNVLDASVGLSKVSLMTTRVALVTGASRGIGKAIALALAQQGYDIVAAARTLKEGSGTVSAPFKEDQRQVPVPGSLEQTALEVEALGRHCLMLQMDMLDRSSLDEMVQQAMAHFGRIDILVNNALYQGPGLMYLLPDIEMQQLEDSMQGNLHNQFYLTRKVLTIMRQIGAGVVVNMTSGSAQVAPPAPADKGGWGFAYAASKSAFHRLAEFINVEFAQHNIRAYNIDPGYTETETSKALFGDNEATTNHFKANKPEDTAVVVRWLVSSDDQGAYSTRTVYTPTFFKKNNIDPDAMES